MSRIDDLIDRLCPKGVDFRELGTLGKRNKGTPMTAAKMKLIGASGGSVRVFAGGQTIADVSEDDVPAKDVVRVPSIIVKSRGNIGFAYYDRPFTHKNELWSYSINDPCADQKFVYYYLLTQAARLQEIARATSVKLPQLGVKDTDTLRIPVPPIEVQREIVRTLDQFTRLETVLEAELEARRRQYEHYRYSLLATSDDVRRVPLKDLFDMRSGRFVAAAEISSERDFRHPFPCYGGNGLRGYVATPNQDGGRVLVGRQGALSGNVHRVNGEFYATEHAVVVTPLLSVEIDIDWAFHMLTAMNLNQYISQGALPGLTVGTLKALLVPIPSLKEQERISSMLNSFDALVNDVSVGLPAELAARRKQFVYYRDRLLTFKEAIT